MNNLIEYDDNYLRKSKSLWLFHRDESALNNNGIIFGF